MNSSLSGIKSSFIKTTINKSTERNITVMQKFFPSGMKLMIALELPPTKTKKALKPCIDELISLGFSRKFISFFINISPSYLSKLSK